MSLIELDDLVSTSLGASARRNFLPALNLLFLLGLLEYDVNSDVIIPTLLARGRHE